MPSPNLDHPTLPRIKERFPGKKLVATEFRGQTTVVVPPDDLHELLAFLRREASEPYDFLSDIVGIDYLNYPANKADGPGGRFGVVYNLIATAVNRRLYIKVLLDNTVDTRGTEEDPALYLPSACDLWPAAEWLEREVFDMFGIRFTDHPDLRRILLWESYPAYPLRKDYPVTGRGEREDYRVVTRESA